MNKEKNTPVERRNIEVILSSGVSLGLVGFGFVVLQDSMLALYQLSHGSVHTIDPMTGQSLFVGGLGQVIAGIVCYFNLDLFHATAFTSFGLNWMGKGLNAYLANYMLPAGTKTAAIAAQRGMLMLTWSIWVIILLASKLSSTLSTLAMLVCLNIHVHFDTLGTWLDSKSLRAVGAIAGIITALLAYYNVGVGMINKKESIFELPRGKALFKSKRDEFSA